MVEGSGVLDYGGLVGRRGGILRVLGVGVLIVEGECCSGKSCLSSLFIQLFVLLHNIF